MRITQAPEPPLNSSAVPLPNVVLARKIPLSVRSPNRIQTIDIHNIIDVESGLFRGSNRFFPLSAASGQMLRQSLREVPMISFAPHRWYPALVALLLAAALAFAVSPSQAAEPAPTGRAVMAWHVTIAPSWFDPSTAPPQITPFGMLYAIHDALVRPYPGQKMGPSLAESWTESEDGLSYPQIPQWRSADDRGCKVQFRTLSRRR